MKTGRVSGVAHAVSATEMEQVLHPGRNYGRPAQVVADMRISLAERRAILSSSASDACAVESNPLLREPPCSSEPVTFEDIMDALAQLDTQEETGRSVPLARRRLEAVHVRH